MGGSRLAVSSFWQTESFYLTKSRERLGQAGDSILHTEVFDSPMHVVGEMEQRIRAMSWTASSARSTKWVARCAVCFGRYDFRVRPAYVHRLGSVWTAVKSSPLQAALRLWMPDCIQSNGTSVPYCQHSSSTLGASACRRQAKW